MVEMALLWRFSARFCSGQPVLWVVRHSASDSLPRVRFHPSVNVKGPASATHLPSNPVLPCMLSTRLYSTEVVDSEKLTFEEYRKLRKSLKMRGRVAGLPMALLGMGISSFVNVQYNPDMFNMAPEDVQPILGMDPIVFSALCGVGSGAAGYILGVAVFHATWKFLFKQKARALQERENDFLKRIQRHRFTEDDDYGTDYYAEKVMTLSDYRQWVRQQQKKQEQLRPTAKTSTDTDS